VQGSFQYVKTQQELKPAVTEIVDLLGSKKISVQVRLANGTTIPVFLNEIGQAAIFMESAELDRNKVIELKVGETLHQVNVEADDPRNSASMIIKFIEDKINTFSRRMTEEKPPRDELMIFKTKVCRSSSSP